MSLSEFQIVNRLGEGAYSSVYKVKRLSDGKEYALKKVKMHDLSDKEKENALNEVRILASIKHFNIIGYKEAFLDDPSQVLCIIMEYADNGDLFQKINDHKRNGSYFPENEIWKIFIQIVRGLKTLHELKIMHRDLKSANVFLNKDGSIKLGDLNVSKVAKKGLGYTQTGTPYYASPEVWKDQPYDAKSDIWSLGCVLYEMIALHPPFRAEDMNGLYKKVLKGQYPKIPGHFSTDLANIVKALLQVSPHLRPTCDKILQTVVVQKRLELIPVENPDTNLENVLLSTIRVPKNLLYLTDKLPKPNYLLQSNTVDCLRRNASTLEPSYRNLPSIRSTKQPSKMNKHTDKDPTLSPIHKREPISPLKESHSQPPPINIARVTAADRSLDEIVEMGKGTSKILVEKNISIEMSPKKSTVYSQAQSIQTHKSVLELKMIKNMKKNSLSISTNNSALPIIKLGQGAFDENRREVSLEKLKDSARKEIESLVQISLAKELANPVTSIKNLHSKGENIIKKNKKSNVKIKKIANLYTVKSSASISPKPINLSLSPVREKERMDVYQSYLPKREIEDNSPYNIKLPKLGYKPHSDLKPLYSQLSSVKSKKFKEKSSTLTPVVKGQKVDINKKISNLLERYGSHDSSKFLHDYLRTKISKAIY